jgi:hypothetical protein
MKGPHPDDLEIALYSSSDLGGWRRFRVWLHVRRCAECQHDLELLAEADGFLKEAAAEMPPDAHWGRRSAEMRANIKLGLEAGAIAGPVEGWESPKARPLAWRVAAGMACATVMVISGWFLYVPRLMVTREGEGPLVLRSTGSGIAMEENGHSLALMHRPSEKVTLTGGTQGQLRARYVDDETGEVTIHHVYVE